MLPKYILLGMHWVQTPRYLVQCRHDQETDGTVWSIQQARSIQLVFAQLKPTALDSLVFKCA